MCAMLKVIPFKKTIRLRVLNWSNSFNKQQYTHLKTQNGNINQGVSLWEEVPGT